MTAAYRPAHMRAKTQSGFRMYANASDRSRLGRIEDEQHMLDWVMELANSNRYGIPLCVWGIPIGKQPFLYMVAVHSGYFLRRQ